MHNSYEISKSNKRLWVLRGKMWATFGPILRKQLKTGIIFRFPFFRNVGPCIFCKENTFYIGDEAVVKNN